MKANQETINQTAEALYTFFGGSPSKARYVANHLAKQGLLKPTNYTELGGWQGGMKSFELELSEDAFGPLVKAHIGTEGKGAYMAIKPFMARHLGNELVKAADQADKAAGR